MQEIVFREWTFQVDSLLTRQTYTKQKTGGSEGCPCGDCKNYRKQKESVFRHEILKLFDRVGIDFRKECETSRVQKLENGLHQYSGWFHFAGKIISGKKCKKQIAENSWQVELTEIKRNFKIGFTIGRDLSFFGDDVELVQVEFESHIPWIIDEPECMN